MLQSEGCGYMGVIKAYAGQNSPGDAARFKGFGAQVSSEEASGFKGQTLEMLQQNCFILQII